MRRVSHYYQKSSGNSAHNFLYGSSIKIVNVKETSAEKWHDIPNVLQFPLVIWFFLYQLSVHISTHGSCFWIPIKFLLIHNIWNKLVIFKTDWDPPSRGSYCIYIYIYIYINIYIQVRFFCLRWDDHLQHKGFRPWHTPQTQTSSLQNLLAHLMQWQIVWPPWWHIVMWSCGTSEAKSFTLW